MWVRAALAGLLFAVAAPAAARTDEPATAVERLCFDVAIVAGNVEATPTTDYPSGPDAILMRWPWHVDLDVEQVLIGVEPRRRLRTFASLHAGFNPRIEHFLMLLGRGESGYGLAGFEFRIVRDARGRFVMPLAAPLPDHDLYPEGWVPRAYRDLLRPVTYRMRDAWWLRPPYLEAEDLSALDPSWGRRGGAGVVALRGLFLDDWAQAIRAEAGALCSPP